MVACEGNWIHFFQQMGLIALPDSNIVFAYLIPLWQRAIVDSQWTALLKTLVFQRVPADGYLFRASLALSSLEEWPS